MNLSVTPTQIDQSQSPDMLNMNIDERGALNKRTGYERVFAESLGNGAINGLYEYRKTDGSVYFLMAHGTKLYLIPDNGLQPISLYTGLADQQVSFFTMNNKCYLLDGAHYLEFDGTTVKEIDPYIPTISIVREPAGGGTIYEDFNLLGTGFKDSFSGDGTAKEYVLSLQRLDAREVKVTIDGVDKKEGTDFTVDRVKGKVTFNTAPTKGTNNVIITAFKTFVAEASDYFSGDGTKKEFQLSRKELDSVPVVASVDGGTTFNKVEGTDFTVDRVKGLVAFITAPVTGTDNVVIKSTKENSDFPKRIKKCRFHVMFGGSNDTRVFVSGNKDMPDYVWASDLYEPAYFPENRFYKFPDKVMGFAKQYDYLVVERVNGKHQISFSLDSGESSFPSKPINDQVGTFAKNSIQIIENNPVSLSKNGVYMLTSSTVRDERNVSHISENVDAKLLQEPNLNKAISVEFDNKYWVAVNGKVYVLDYAQRSQYNPYGEWYLYDNIHASCFIEKDGYLYFGSSTDGLLYRFKKTDELFPYNDDGEPIKCHWISKVLSFGMDERRKIVEKVFFSIKPYIHTSADLYYVSDKKSRKFIKTTRKDLFHYSYVDYSFFTYGSRDFPQEATNKIKAKKIVYFQLEVRNEKVDEAFGMLSLGIKYDYQSFVK